MTDIDVGILERVTGGLSGEAWAEIGFETAKSAIGGAVLGGAVCGVTGFAAAPCAVVGGLANGALTAVGGYYAKRWDSPR